MSKIKPGDKLIAYGAVESILVEMVDYNPHDQMYLVVKESKLSEIDSKPVPKVEFKGEVPEELESFMTTEVLNGNEKLKESFWVKADTVRKINMEPLSGIQKFIAKVFDL